MYKYYILGALHQSPDGRNIRPDDYTLKHNKYHRTEKEARKVAANNPYWWVQYIYAIGEKESDWKLIGAVTNKLTGEYPNYKSHLVFKKNKKTYRLSKDGSIRPW